MHALASDTHTPTGFSIGRARAGVQAIAAGWYHNIALKSDGTVWGTGNNEKGQLGVGTTTHKNTFVSVSDWGISGQ